jgi:hypothetical protein
MKPNKQQQLDMADRWDGAPCSPSFNDCDTWDFFSRLGGDHAIMFGVWRTIPARQRWKKADMGRRIAEALRGEQEEKST